MSHYEFCIIVFFKRTGSSCPCSLFILKNKGVMLGKEIKHSGPVVIIFKKCCLCLTSSKLLWNLFLQFLEVCVWACVCAPTLLHCAFCCLKTKKWSWFTEHSTGLSLSYFTPSDNNIWPQLVPVVSSIYLCFFNVLMFHQLRNCKCKIW